VQWPAHTIRFALGVEPVGDGQCIRIRFEHRVELGIELGDAGEILGTNGT